MWFSPKSLSAVIGPCRVARRCPWSDRAGHAGLQACTTDTFYRRGGNIARKRHWTSATKTSVRQSRTRYNKMDCQGQFCTRDLFAERARQPSNVQLIENLLRVVPSVHADIRGIQPSRWRHRKSEWCHRRRLLETLPGASRASAGRSVGLTPTRMTAWTEASPRKTGSKEQSGHHLPVAQTWAPTTSNRAMAARPRRLRVGRSATGLKSCSSAKYCSQPCAYCVRVDSHRRAPRMAHAVMAVGVADMPPKTAGAPRWTLAPQWLDLSVAWTALPAVHDRL